MKKKSGGMFTLLTGVALGAAAVFLSNPKNRKKTDKVIKKESKKIKKTASEVKKVAKKKGRKLKSKVVKAQEKREQNY